MQASHHVSPRPITLLQVYRPLPAVVRFLLFTLAYAGGVELAFILTFPITNFLTFWPAGGLFVAALLLADRRDWPLLCLGAYAATTLLDALHGRNLLAGQMYIVGNCSEALTGAWLVRHYVGQPSMARLKDVIGLTALSAVVGTALCATIGVSANVMLLGGSGFFNKWFLWWSSNMLGVLVVAPFLLTLFTKAWNPRLTRPSRILEFGMLAGLIIGAAWLVAQYIPTWGHLSIVVVPLIIWAALRFGPFGASGVSALLAFILVWIGARGHAALPVPTSADIWLLQVFLAVTILVGLVLAAVLAEREADREALLASETRLRQSEKMEAIGHLAGGVAHDFNNMLTSIVGNAEMLLDTVNPQDRKCVEDILKAAGRSADLTRKLLAFARKGKYRSVPVDLHAVIVEVVAILAHSLDKRIVVKEILSASPPTTQGDPTQIQGALLNLALNARDAMPEGGELTLATEVVELSAEDCRMPPFDLTPGRYIAIRVTDTGRGMDADTLSHLYEPFFTTKHEGAGTGLGLAAAYGAIRNHHGAITVGSVPHQGTTFTIYLPLHEGETQEDSKPAAPASPGVGHILLVDDEELVREVASRMLRSLGYRVTLCSGGKEAIEIYRKDQPNIDLVILDLIMPDVSGRDTFRALRTINPAVKALLASGHSFNKDMQTVLDEGALGLIEKPFSIAGLSRMIAQAMASLAPF
ncbi:MAG: MASE1 domain-containing protein [Lentisphaerae bacterium]|nr:MASE1 domain-containing protein [Lentisphaerota bacterium]